MKIKKILIELLIMFFLCNSVALTDSYVDSLKRKLNTSGNEKKISLLLKISESVRNNSPEESLQYARQAYNLALKSDDKIKQAYSLKNIGIIYAMQNDYKSSINHFNKALMIYKDLDNTKDVANIYYNIGKLNYNIGEYGKSIINYYKSLNLLETNDNKNYIGDVYLNLGAVYEKISDYPKALDYFLKSLNIYRNLRDSIYISGAINNIANIYYHMGNNNKAMEYYQKSLDISYKMNDKKNISETLNNIGNIYLSIGLVDTALSYYIRTSEINNQLLDRYGEAIACHNIGNVYLIKEDFQKSQLFFQKSLKISEEIDDNKGIADSYLNLAKLSYKTKAYYKALDYIEKCKNYYLIENISLKKQETYLLLSDIFSAKGDLNKSYQYYKKYSNLKDSLYKDSNDKLLSAIKMKADAENIIEKLQIDKKIEQARTEKLKFIIASIISILLLSLIALTIIYNMYGTIKTKNHELEELNSMQSKIYETLISDLRNSLFNIMTNVVQSQYEQPTINVNNSLKDFSNKYNRLLQEIEQKLN